MEIPSVLWLERFLLTPHTVFSLLSLPTEEFPALLLLSPLTPVTVGHGGSPHPVRGALDPVAAPEHVAVVTLELHLLPEGVLGSPGAGLCPVGDDRAGALHPWGQQQQRGEVRTGGSPAALLSRASRAARQRCQTPPSRAGRLRDAKCRITTAPLGRHKDARALCPAGNRSSSPAASLNPCWNNQGELQLFLSRHAAF